MPIQWGPCVKKIAEVGIEECEFCHEPAPFTIYSQSTQIRLMFLVPLADFNSKKFLVCERCRHSWELQESKALGLIAKSKMMPGHEAATALWNAFDTAVEAWIKKGELRDQCNTVAKLLECVGAKLKTQFPPSHVDIMAHKYFNWCKDDTDRD